jgi:protein required for attachment to host cells
MEPMMSKPQWTLVANASSARLFRQDGDGPMTPVGTFAHPSSREHSSVLGDDKAGRELSGHGFGGAAFEPRLDAQRKERLRFGRELAETLEAGAREGSYGSLRLFAGSPFLGELKQLLGPATQRLLAGAHDLDLTHVGLAELGARIRDEIAADAHH